MSRLERTKNNWQPEKPIAIFPPEKDVFRLGIYYDTAKGELEVILIADHSSGKVRPLLNANCWIHIHKHQTEIREGDIVDIFPGP